MINWLIDFSLRNRFVVLLVAAGITAYGIYAVKTTPVDAIPDLSENQVIIFTEWMGRSPQLVEDVVRLKVKPIENTHTERLQYFIDQAESSNGKIAMAWEKVRIEFPFAVKR